MTATAPGRPRVFRGWYVVAGVFVMLTVAAGIGFYGLSVYLRALSDEQGFSVGVVSAATACFFVVGGLVGLPAASFTARRDPRPLVAAGALACALALLLLGRLTQTWQLFVAYGLFGAGFAAAGLVPGTTLVTRWFARRRSLALSVATTGLSAGGVLLTPGVAAVVDAHGLRAVAPWLALAFVVGFMPVMALLRPSPQALRLEPDGGAPARHGGAGRRRGAPVQPGRRAAGGGPGRDRGVGARGGEPARAARGRRPGVPHVHAPGRHRAHGGAGARVAAAVHEFVQDRTGGRHGPVRPDRRKPADASPPAAGRAVRRA